MTKKFLFAITLCFLFNITSLKAVTYNSEPQIFIQELVDDAIKTLSDKSITQQDKNLMIEKIAKKNVDIKALGLYTLGSIRKELDPNIINDYQNLFEKYFLKTLTSRLTDYSSQNFEIIGSEQKSANYTIVNSKIAESVKSPEIKIDWRIYTKNPENPMIRDLIIEGLSLARTQKEEFSSILNSNNGDISSLFKVLKEFSKN